MQSKWYDLKPTAIKLRKRGLSIGKIEQRLNIRRSTLSGWFKNIELTPKQKERLAQDWKNGLVKARKKAVLWHNAQKEKRLLEARNAALKTLGKIDMENIYILELALAFLYLGEGTKKTTDTSIGSSDPLILNFFLNAVKKIYGLNTKKIRCELYLRSDQNPINIKKFWAKTIHMPISNFKQINIDKRTAGIKTYAYYKGVCNLRCGNVAIQRKLINIANLFSKRIIENRGN